MIDLPSIHTFQPMAEIEVTDHSLALLAGEHARLAGAFEQLANFDVTVGTPVETAAALERLGVRLRRHLLDIAAGHAHLGEGLGRARRRYADVERT